MIYDEFKELVSQIRYKPNFTLTIEPNMHNDGYILRFEFKDIIDAYDPSLIKRAKFHSVLKLSKFALEYMDRETLLYKIYSQIRDMEIHEVNEFFLVNGIRPYNPHYDDPL